MDHSSGLHQYPEGHRPPDIPVEWGEPVVIGNGLSEDGAPTEIDFVDDRFGPTEIGAEEAEAADGPTPTDDSQYISVEADEDDTPAPDAAADTTSVASASDDGADVPPDIPLLVANAEGDPNPGRALRELVEFVSGAESEIEMHVHDVVLTGYDDGDIQLYMIDHDIDPEAGREAAVDRLGNRREDADSDDVNESIRSRAIDATIDVANRVYGDKLAAAGVGFFSDGDTIALEIVDPASFTEAVGQLPPPSSEEEQADFNDLIERAIYRAVAKISSTIIATNPEAAVDSLNTEPEENLQLSVDINPEVYVPSPEERHLAYSMLANAGTLADNLYGAGIKLSDTDPLRQLDIAQSEGLSVPWAVAVSLDIIGKSHRPIGIERLATPEEWRFVYAFVQKLAATEWYSMLISEVRMTLYNDIRATVEVRQPPPDSNLNLHQYEQATLLLREASIFLDLIFTRRPTDT